MKEYANRILQYSTLRYLISGGVSQTLEFICFVILMAAWGNLTGSISVSFIVGIAIGFGLHRFWSFAGDHHLKKRHQALSYATLAITNFLIANLSINLLVHQLSIAPVVAKLVSMIAIATWSYLVFNKIIFRRRA